MTTLSKVDITRQWTLVYDAVVDGPFVGYVSSIANEAVSYRVDVGLPSSSDPGVPVSGPIRVTLSGDKSDKLYAKSVDNTAQIIMDASLAPEALPSWLRSSDEETARLKVSVNEQLFDGIKALTVQSFSEVNSKLGTQYEASFYLGALAGQASVDIVIIVGSDPIAFKEIQLLFDNPLISTQIFRGPTYSDGSPITVYNLNDEQAVSGTASLIGGVNTTVVGTPVGPKIYSLGSEGIGNRTIGAVSQGTGVERILWPGATYLYRVTNETLATPTRISGVATWYQGPLSTQTPLVL